MYLAENGKINEVTVADTTGELTDTAAGSIQHGTDGAWILA